ASRRSRPSRGRRCDLRGAALPSVAASRGAGGPGGARASGPARGASGLHPSLVGRTPVVRKPAPRGSAGAARHTEALRELPQVLLEATRPGTCRRAVTFRTCPGTSTSAASIQHLSLERREQALAAGAGPKLDEADQLPAAL